MVRTGLCMFTNHSWKNFPSSIFKNFSSHSTNDDNLRQRILSNSLKQTDIACLFELWQLISQMSYTIFFNIITVFTFRLRSNFACHSLLPQEATGIYLRFNIVHSQYFHKISFAELLFRYFSISQHTVILVFAFLNRHKILEIDGRPPLVFHSFLSKGTLNIVSH